MSTNHLNRNGTVYVYDSHSYTDKETGERKTDRKLIGKLDPATGKVVPTRKYVRKKPVNAVPAVEKTQTAAPAALTAMKDKIQKLEAINESLRAENQKLKETLHIYQDAAKKAGESLAVIAGRKEI